MDFVNSYVQLNARHDYPIAFARKADEFSFLLNKARELRLLENHPHDIENVRLTIEGWQRVVELRKTEPDSDQAFVAMSFSDELVPAWSEGFKRALDETGYKPLRLDLKEHNDKVCDQIIAEIRKSGLLIADFTGQRGGVYFEAGFAMGLGIPVIWSCRDTDVDACHVDTRQYYHIVWKEPSDLRVKLVRRIEATVPRLRGPSRP